MQTKVIDPLTRQIVYGTYQSTVNAFLIDRRSRGLSHRTIQFYQDELRYFSHYLDTVGVQMMDELTPDTIRRYLLALSERRNSGGCHAAYRAIKALLNWFDFEYEPVGWKNPMRKVQSPELKTKPQPGISIPDFQKLLDGCITEFADRDKAILLALIDTGLRGSEFVSLDFGDVDIQTGALKVRHGKGDKMRTVYMGKKTMRALRKYLKSRSELKPSSPLFASDENDRLTFSGLRQIVRRRADAVGVQEPGLHDFRRAFALQCLRNGMSLITVSRLLGHSNISVTQRYICQDESDLALAHQNASPVDRM